MATCADQEQEGFWEELEKQFDRQIPVEHEVRYALDTVFKSLDVFDPEEREEVIDAAVHIAYEIVTAVLRREDAKQVQREVVDNMSEEDKRKAEEEKKKAEEDKKKAEEDKKKAVEERSQMSQMSQRVATKQGEIEGYITPGDFLEKFEWVEKLPKKCEQRETPKEEIKKLSNQCTVIDPIKSTLKTWNVFLLNENSLNKQNFRYGHLWSIREQTHIEINYPLTGSRVI